MFKNHLNVSKTQAHADLFADNSTKYVDSKQNKYKTIKLNHIINYFER